MKKVKNSLSVASLGKSSAKRCAAAFSAAVVAVTSVTCIVQLSFDRGVSAQAAYKAISSREILELSESYLSRNTEKPISVIELTTESAFVETESEAASNVSASSETAETVAETSEKVTETVTSAPSSEKVTEKKPEKTTEKQTEKVTKPAASQTNNVDVKPADTKIPAVKPSEDKTTQEKIGYTFKELGLKQMSEIPVPDDILFDENGIPLNYTKKLTGKSTAYCMGHTTATGTSVHPGVVAVNPKIIPYGSKMYIVSSDGLIYGYSSAEDTGGFIHWKNAPIVDLYVYSKSTAYQWGNRSVTIYIF